MNNVNARLLNYSMDTVIHIQSHYPDSEFVMESSLMGPNGWTLSTYLIFWTPTKHPEGSNYFAIGPGNNGKTVITDGISATTPFKGILVDDQVCYSINRHDYYQCPNSTSKQAIDGGRDYTRVTGGIYSHKMVDILIKGKELVYEHIKHC